MINLFNSIGTMLRFFNYNPYVGVATGALYSVYSPTFCSYKLSPNFTAINSRVARVSFRLIERCQCWVEVTEALLLPGDMCFLSFVLLLARL
jgi:hypothetical protein